MNESTNPQALPLVMPLPAAVRFSGLTEQRLRKANRNGDVAMLKDGRRTFVLTSTLVEYIERLCATTAPDPSLTAKANEARRGERFARKQAASEVRS